MDIVIVKRIAALRTEFRRILGIFRLPAAFVTLVKRYACRLLCAAVAAELAFIYSTTAAGPAIFFRLFGSAFYTEPASIDCPTAAGPAVTRL